MTSTRAINAAAGVIHAAVKQGKTIPASIAYALDSAGLLNSPEIAAELEHLRKRVAELDAAAGDGSTRTADEDPITYALTAEAEALHASSGAVVETTTEPSVEPNGCAHCGVLKREHMQRWTPSARWHQWAAPSDEQIKERMLRRRSVNELRELLGRQREDAYRSPLHHDYRTPHDLPDVTS